MTTALTIVASAALTYFSIFPTNFLDLFKFFNSFNSFNSSPNYSRHQHANTQAATADINL